jgi:RNA polymerase sigma-70 factor, ECF subfamily
MTDRLIPFRRPQGYAALSDEALLADCARGNNLALDELFQRHGDRVHRILARLGSPGWPGSMDRRDLEDLVQATFLQVQRSAARFDGRAAAGTWIVGIALNLARHHRRGEARRRSLVSAVAQVLPPEGERPDEQAANRQLLARLQAGLEMLPQELKTVFTLCDLEGMRGVDVARAMGIPEGTIWRRLHDARTRLRAHVEGNA